MQKRRARPKKAKTRKRTMTAREPHPQDGATSFRLPQPDILAHQIGDHLRVRAAKAKRKRPQPQDLSAENRELAARFSQVHNELLGAALVAADIAMKTTSKNEAERSAQCFMATALSLIEKAKRIATPFRLPLQVFGQTLRYPQDLDANGGAEYQYSRSEDDREGRPEMSEDEFRDQNDQTIGVVPTFMGDGYWDSSNMCTANAPWFDGEDFVRQSRAGILSDSTKGAR